LPIADSIANAEWMDLVAIVSSVIGSIIVAVGIAKGEIDV
jgi:hypothetical protein